MLEELKQIVLEQNLALVKYGLVTLTWGNVSAIDRQSGLVVIKPSGVEYDKMTIDDMVVVDLATKKVVEGNRRPSSDTPTHLYLYEAFADIGGVVHTHSTYATAWAQSCESIPAYGTTHADAYCGAVPITRALTKDEVENDYEKNTGKVIVETMSGKDYNAIPAILVKNHGPFTWGASAKKAVENAVTLEEVAKMATLTRQINPTAPQVPDYLLDKHYLRKHGANAYYGQKSE